MSEWLQHATSIWSCGYEAFRENIEIRVWNDDALGHPLDIGKVTPVKGFGRVSILMFGIIWTYVNKEALTPDAEADFKTILTCIT